MKGKRKPKFWERLISKFHKRIHPWPDAKNLDFFRYRDAMLGARYCYWAPWGWFPWSGIVIRWRYGRER